MPILNSSAYSSVVIACAGGFGHEMHDYLLDEARNGGPVLAGFIDDTKVELNHDSDIKQIGTISDYRPVPGQAVILAIGSAKSRHNLLDRMASNSIDTPSYVHPSAIVSSASCIESGVIICPYTIINHKAKMSYGSVANVHCSVGHHAVVGEYSIISPYAALNGNAVIGERCFLGTRATIYPRIRIGNDCIVESHCAVRFDASDNQLISSRGTYKANTIRVPSKFI